MSNTVSETALINLDVFLRYSCICGCQPSQPRKLELVDNYAIFNEQNFTKKIIELKKNTVMNREQKIIFPKFGIYKYIYII